MKPFIAIILIIFCVYSLIVLNDSRSNSIKELAEYAYFEGQRDALNGDVRIKINSDSSYSWIKSPWDETKEQPTYIPSKEEETFIYH